MSFPCTRCLLCCTTIGILLDNKDQLDELTQFMLSKFPYKPLENGTCSQLSEYGECKVYDHRPIVCNVKLMAKLRGKTEEEYFKETASHCNQMMDRWGVEKSYRITDYD